MRPYQKKYFEQGYRAAERDLTSGTDISHKALMELMADMCNTRTEMTEKTVTHDAAGELSGMVSEKFPASNAILYELAGRLSAIIGFANVAMKKGMRITNAADLSTYLGSEK
jgi:hypothetical protein